MTKKVLLLLVLVVWCSGMSKGAILSYSTICVGNRIGRYVEHGDTGMYVTEPVSSCSVQMPQFDPSFGTLNAVYLTWSFTVDLELARLECQSPHSLDYGSHSLLSQVNIQIDGPDGTLLYNASMGGGYFDTSGYLPPSDGKADFSGPGSVVIQFPGSGISGPLVTTTLSDLNSVYGYGRLDLPITLYTSVISSGNEFNSFWSSPGDWQVEACTGGINPQFSYILQADYYYTPIPEPFTFSFLTLGSLTPFWPRRR